MVAKTKVPLSVTAVAPDRFVPVIVAGTVVPSNPSGGVIDVMVGPDCMTVAETVELFERSRKPVKAAVTRR
jgi:hypothetical protein